jgi:hypothetical protein
MGKIKKPGSPSEIPAPDIALEKRLTNINHFDDG